MNLIPVDLMLLRDSGRPRLNWDSETEFSRKLGLVNMIAIVLGLIMFVLFFVSVVAFPLMTFPGFASGALIASGALSLVVLAAAFAVDLAVMKKAAGNLERLEA